jgi:transposase-like protein
MKNLKEWFKIMQFEPNAEQYQAIQHINPPRTADDVQDALKAVFAETLQAMLDSELDTHLGYDKYAIQEKHTTNSRNGHSRKTGPWPIRVLKSFV